MIRYADTYIRALLPRANHEASRDGPVDAVMFNDGLALKLSQAAYSVVSSVASVAASLSARQRAAAIRRKTIRELSQLNDAMLRDIGLERGEISSVAESMSLKSTGGVRRDSHARLVA